MHSFLILIANHRGSNHSHGRDAVARRVTANRQFDPRRPIPVKDFFMCTAPPIGDALRLDFDWNERGYTAPIHHSVERNLALC